MERQEWCEFCGEEIAFGVRGGWLTRDGFVDICEHSTIGHLPMSLPDLTDLEAVASWLAA